MNKVTFPHMGESYRAFKMLLNDLGNEVVLPPRPTMNTISLGVQYTPEFACFPLKILMGTYLETVQMGADTLITTGGVGPCRAGHYAELHKKILHDLGYPIAMIVFEPPHLYPLNFINNVHKLNKAKLSIKAIKEQIKKGWRLLQALDNIEKLTHIIRPRELKKGATSQTYKLILERLDGVNTLNDIIESETAAIEELHKIPIDPDRLIVKVGIVGEIYVLLEPASNLEIEQALGNLGAEVERSMFLTGWARDNNWKESTEGMTVKDAALPYLPELIGGHGRDSIGHTVLYAKRNFDGVIQLAPFTCIPEIVARTILPAVSKDYDIPVLTFFIDEQTGKAGISTRLEAFVDLMKRKKLKKLHQAAV